MKLTKSLRFRIIIACVVFALIVSTVFGFILNKSIKFTADEQFNWYIEKEMDYFVQEYNLNKNIEFNDHRGMVIVSDEKAAINQIQTIIGVFDINSNIKRLQDLSFKSYKLNTKNGYFNYVFKYQEKNIYLLKANLKDSLGIYYIVDFTGFNKHDNKGANISTNMFFIMIVVIFVFAIFIGLYIAKKVLEPLTNLTDNVDKIDIGEYKSNVGKYYNDEIGFLAKRIDSFVDRTAKFVEREKAFSRDASHELRTPVASSQAALDVALALPQGQDPKIKKILQRIQRANKNMTHLIESFLILGREKQENKDEIEFNLKELVDTSIKKNNYLINSTAIRYENNIDETLSFKLSKEYLSIIINNLIRNAFTHMQDGTLFIDASDSQILLSDTCEWFDDSQELGIGLNIVKRICKEENWKFNISTIKNIGTQIKIEFL